MTEQGDPSGDQKHKTEIRKLRIDEHFKDDALGTIKRLVTGNGLDPEKVSLVRFEGEVLRFQAETILQISTKISKITKGGRVKGPVQVAGETQAKEAIHKEYVKLAGDRDMRRKIREVVTGRPDRGFGQDGIVIPLPFWRKEFVIFEECKTCRAKGTVACQRCAGKGYEPCTLCHGSGMATCVQCLGGQQIVGPNGQKSRARPVTAAGGCPAASARKRAACSA